MLVVLVNPCTFIVGMLISPATMGKSMPISQKNKKEPLCDPVIPFLSIHLKVPKSAYHGDTCRLMFIVAQFTTANIRDPPRCL